MVDFSVFGLVIRDLICKAGLMRKGEERVKEGQGQAGYPFVFLCIFLSRVLSLISPTTPESILRISQEILAFVFHDFHWRIDYQGIRQM